MAKKEVIGRCPVCAESLEVTQLSCPACNTKISGQFQMCKFCGLTSKQKYFAEVFIKNRGNIKEVEKELEISYPTVRGRLEELIRTLGYQVDSDIKTMSAEEHAKNRKLILDKLSQGEITAPEAIKLLRDAGSV